MTTGEVRKRVWRVGTRKSELAMVQTHLVVDSLKSILPEPYNSIEIVSMTTTGDKILDSPLHKIGAKALFTKELEQALLDGSVDMVVHSLKDLPTRMPHDNLHIGAYLDRVDPHDVVVMSQQSISNGYSRLEDLPDGSRIGTSSVRRIAQLKMNYPLLQVRDIRGNLNTRLRKLDDTQSDEYDAIILAYAGMHRLHWDSRISQRLPCKLEELNLPGYGSKLCYYAVGQGALAIECRKDDLDTREVLRQCNDLDTQLRVMAERELMACLEGGCSVPIGVSCYWLDKSGSTVSGVTTGKTMKLHGRVSSCDGQACVEGEMEMEVVDVAEAQRLGSAVGQLLIQNGAKSILDEIHRQKPEAVTEC